MEAKQHEDVVPLENMHLEDKVPSNETIHVDKQPLSDIDLKDCIATFKDAIMMYIHTNSFVRAIRRTQEVWADSRFINLTAMDLSFSDINTVLEDLKFTIMYAKQDNLLIATFDGEDEVTMIYPGFVLGHMNMINKEIIMEKYDTYDVNTYKLADMVWWKVMTNDNATMIPIRKHAMV